MTLTQFIFFLFYISRDTGWILNNSCYFYYILFYTNLSCGYFMCRLLINSNTQRKKNWKKIKVCFAMAPKQMLSYKQHTFGVFIFFSHHKVWKLFCGFLVVSFLEPAIRCSLFVIVE